MPDQVQPLLHSTQYKAVRAIAEASINKEDFYELLLILGFSDKELSELISLHLERKKSKNLN